MLVHVGAAHAGRPGRAGSPIQSARAGNLEKRAPRPDARMGPAAALLGGSIRPRRSSRGAVRKLAARPLVALAPTAAPEGPCGPSPRGDLGVGPTSRQGRGPTLGAQAHSPLVRDSGRRARTCRFTHCALPWQRPTLGGPTQSPPYVHSRASASRWAVRMRTARIARIADRLDGMPRCHPRVWPWWLHAHARGYAVLRLTRGDD